MRRSGPFRGGTGRLLAALLLGGLPAIAYAQVAATATASDNMLGTIADR